MTSRRSFVAALISLPLAAHAQQMKAHRVGYLLLTPLTHTPSPERAAFVAELRSLGYTEGRNLRIEYRSADGNREALAGLAEQLVRERVEVIVATSTPGARAAAHATRDIPVVFIGVGDAQRAKLVKNFARPEANVTGVTWLTFETVSKRFQLLKETLPRAARVALVWNPGDGGSIEQHALVLEAAGRLRLELDDYHVAGTAVAAGAGEIRPRASGCNFRDARFAHGDLSKDHRRRGVEAAHPLLLELPGFRRGWGAHVVCRGSHRSLPARRHL